MIGWVLFWGSVALIAGTLVAFPALVAVRARLFAKPIRADDITPHVSIVIAAHNEAAVIFDKLRNVLDSDYPADRLEVVVVSDGSDDGTADEVRRICDDRIRLVERPRQGKAAALNGAVPQTRGEILVFSDANSMFDRPSMRQLIAPFADPQVGGVAGNQVYDKPQENALANQGEADYWRWETRLKQWESNAGNVIAATGAIYAIRRTLFEPVPEGVTDDFVISTRVIRHGRRLVFAPRAIAREPVASNSYAEFGRKVRVMTRGYRSVWTMRDLLNPTRYGFYSVQLLFHKVLRRLMAGPLLGLLAGAAWLAWEHPLYLSAFCFQVAFYALALVGWLAQGSAWEKHKCLALPFYVCMTYAAAVVAFARFLFGRPIVTWTSHRDSTDAETFSVEQSHVE